MPRVQTPAEKLKWLVNSLKGYQIAISKMDIPSPNRLAINYEIERVRKHLAAKLKEAQNAISN